MTFLLACLIDTDHHDHDHDVCMIFIVTTGPHNYTIFLLFHSENSHKSQSESLLTTSEVSLELKAAHATYQNIPSSLNGD